MIVFLLALLLLVIGAVIAVVMGRTGGMSVEMAEPVSALAPLQLPEGPLGPDDLATVRLDRAVRGYRMDQVDDLLDRLRLQLAAGAVSPRPSEPEGNADPISPRPDLRLFPELED